MATNLLTTTRRGRPTVTHDRKELFYEALNLFIVASVWH